MYKLFTLLFVTLCINAYAQVDLSYYLPSEVEYNTAIPTPESVIGHQVGEWHVSHDKLVYYMHALADASDRIELHEYAKTFEGRPLLYLTITSPENLRNIESIKENHSQLSNADLSKNLDISKMPAVAYLGYSVHGNEASGSNASLLAAYYLAAAQGNEIDQLLENTIILLDPSFNPDGMQRFSGWVNSRKSATMNSDPNNMEQNETWPGGRTNHYWFDLNRDWLPVQLPESRGRIAVFQEWKPNVLTDHHEMGTNSTFFFQPGIPSRNNPLTPEGTYDLTRRLGEYHARALDKIGSLYYTQESFDDFYYGKGSTYPDIQGGVGILFEQASSRGHAQDSDNGVLTFPFAIRNHFTTTLSTLKAVLEMKEDFLNHQRTFYQQVAKESSSDNGRAYLFGSKDRYRNYHLAELISRHRIDVFRSKEALKINNIQYTADELYMVPLAQPQYRLIKTIFEKNTDFQDSLFYDVSTWTLPLAFGMDYTLMNDKAYKDKTGVPFNAIEKPMGEVVGGTSDYAYAFEWNEYYTPKMLYALLDKGYKMKVATEPFNTADKKFERGAILLPVSTQGKSSSVLYGLLAELARENGINVYALKTGLDYQSVSLGSPSFKNIIQPKTMMLVGDGVSSYDAGEVWHLFDQRYDIDLSLVPIDEFNRIDIDKYNVLIMVNGTYTSLTEAARNKLKQWVLNGGTLVASKNSLTYLSGLGLGKFEFVKAPGSDSTSSNTSYADISKINGAREIGGSIFEVHIDRTHPLFYGYPHPEIPVFRNTRLFMKPSVNPHGNPMSYTNSPRLSGYISEGNLNKLKGTSAAGVTHYGKGVVIGFTDDLNFRAFWYGTNKIFMNAVFFGPIINRKADR